MGAPMNLPDESEFESIRELVSKLSAWIQNFETMLDEIAQRGNDK